MKIEVRAQPQAKKNKIEELGPQKYKVWLTSPAVEGKANGALIEYLAEHFKIKRRQIKIIRGKTSRDKIIEIFSS